MTVTVCITVSNGGRMLGWGFYCVSVTEGLTPNLKDVNSNPLCGHEVGAFNNIEEL
jgi:hypothetical protein